MHHLSIFSDADTDNEGLNRQLAGMFDLRRHRFRGVPDADPALYTVVDTNLKDSARLSDFKDWMAKKPKDGKVIFVVDKGSHLEETRAFALGATGVLHRPFNRRDLLNQIWGDFDALARVGPEFHANRAPGVIAAFDALQNVFGAACLGTQVDPALLDAAGAEIVAHIGAQGLANWIDAVRKHHSQTYQHCLLVTGLAVAFGQHLGLSQADRMRLSFAGLLHDVGKARIPVSILEKPTQLDEVEIAVMRNHPQLGVEALATVPGLKPEMLDMVLHHHEYLDGSGYPHGLQGSEIKDLVRIMTIVDVFGALIERRPYKAALTGGDAYRTLLDMGSKLDLDLVREFLPVARFNRQR
jgi:putative nucleotidyltransferase with HDIG domain